MYDSEILSSVPQQYHAAGWQHMVSTHEKDGGSGATDLWIRFENKAIRNIAVLFAGQNQLNFIAVSDMDPDGNLAIGFRLKAIPELF